MVSQSMNDETSQEVVFRWRRLVIQIGLVDVHVVSGSIIHHMETMRARIAEEARKAYEKAAGSRVKDPKGKKQSAPKNTNAPMHQTQGKLQSRSLAQKWIYDPEMCMYKEMVPRGNDEQLWFTCLTCGSRWERLSTEVCQAQVCATAVPLAAPPGPAQRPSTTPSVSPQEQLATSSSQTQLVTSSEKNPRDIGRKTEDLEMIGLSPMGQRAFERCQ